MYKRWFKHSKFFADNCLRERKKLLPTYSFRSENLSLTNCPTNYHSTKCSLFNNYSMSPRWIQGGKLPTKREAPSELAITNLVSNKGE